MNFVLDIKLQNHSDSHSVNIILWGLKAIEEKNIELKNHKIGFAYYKQIMMDSFSFFILTVRAVELKL